MGGSVILLNIVGGVALLIWGTRMVRTGIVRAHGAGLRRVLAASTRNRLLAFIVGMGATAVMQSSTATALMVVSFASRELIALAPALALMLGADVGTTLVAQLLSLDLGWLSPALILAGLVSFLSVSGGRRRHLGRAVIGLGLMLLSLDLIVRASTPLRELETFMLVLGTLGTEPLLAFLLTVLLTWLAHSSLAIVLLVMSLGLGGVIGLDLALAMVLGANVGGAIAPVAIHFRAPATARRVPLGNLAMRLVGALVVLPLIPLVIPWLALLEGDVARRIVDFHTGFNIALALLFLPLIGSLARLLEKLLPAAPDAEDPGQARYLDESELDTPRRGDRLGRARDLAHGRSGGGHAGGHDRGFSPQRCQAGARNRGDRRHRRPPARKYQVLPDSNFPWRDGRSRKPEPHCGADLHHQP